MLRPAQCEKAVTIPEPMGRPHIGLGVPIGSKTPIDLGAPVTASIDSWVSGSCRSCLSVNFMPIFNGLQAEKAWGGSPVHDVREGNYGCTRGERFGPNFVTIQPSGVCVCSI